MNRIILALDTTNLEEAINITKKIKDKIFTIKLGLEFFNAHGKNGIKEFNNTEKKKLYKIAKKLKLVNVKFVKTEGIEFNFPFDQ